MSNSVIYPACAGFLVLGMACTEAQESVMKQRSVFYPSRLVERARRNAAEHVWAAHVRDAVELALDQFERHRIPPPWVHPSPGGKHVQGRERQADSAVALEIDGVG